MIVMGDHVRDGSILWALHSNTIFSYSLSVQGIFGIVRIGDIHLTVSIMLQRMMNSIGYPSISAQHSVD